MRPVRPAKTLPAWWGFLAAVGAGCGDAAPPAAPNPPADTLPAVNAPPVVRLFPTTAEHDVLYDVVLAATDADGDDVTIGVPTRPAWLDFEAATGRLYGTPGEARLGETATVTVAATDGRATTRRTATVAVVLGKRSLTFSTPWGQQTPHRFGHDSLVITTAHTLVYSDFSGIAERQALATMLEEIYDSLSNRLGVGSDAEDAFPPGGRLHVYADKYQGDPAYGYNQTVNGWAFRDGVIVMAADAPRYVTGGYYPARFRGLVTHEFMHDVEFLLIGRAQSTAATDAWFREGIATYMAGLAPGGVPIESATPAQAETWRQAHTNVADLGNPIAIHTFSDFASGANTGTYYFWFAQAIRYMVDPGGFGLGELGLRQVYDDVRAGMSFADSFQGLTGLSLATFEAEFWTRLDAFLTSRTGSEIR